MKALLQTLALVLFAGVGSAYAQNIHFVDGPTVQDLGTTYKVCGKIAGLGNNQLAVITLQGTRTVTTQCTNKGGNIAPGQTKTEAFQISGSYSSNQNGQITFCLTSLAPTPGMCPNGNWTGTVTDASFATVKVLVNGNEIN